MLTILATILNCSHYQKSQKWLPWLYHLVWRLAINTKHYQVWVNLQLEHVVSHLGSHLWWQPLPKILQMNTMAPQINMEACNIIKFGSWVPWLHGHDYHGSTIQDLNQTPLWVNLWLKYVVSTVFVAIWDSSHYQKSQKITIAPPFKIEVCNKN